ncbi:hypothetical protein [Microbacterium sp. MYb62]|uniref:hypothetical protein n=1 Tax=Microbacterium sp. MYb62 TaxID=1848690 RepID=UPI000CFC0E4B|nr:hypothetical protein [Microbacterium sp. MYb62]PRB18279.1 hypothetical protein CQ042_03000 [Microbacterium sp. MYb62]
MRARSGRPELTLHVQPVELCRTPPRSRRDDQFVAQLGSVALGSTSYLVGREGQSVPEWIVLDYATGGHERIWRRTRPHADGVLAYALVEDDSSNGYVTVA